MEALLAQIAGMSVTASYLAVAVALLHLLLKKAPKSLLCGLWGLVGIRLVCPFSVESVFSLLPRQTAVSREILYTPVPGSSAVLPSSTIPAVPAVSGETAAPIVTAYPAVSLGNVIAAVWMLGAAAMLAYGLVSSLRIRKKVSPALCMEGNVFICDYIDSPFIFGIRNPRIYLPSGLDGETSRYVLAHERAHLSRRDHWWKLLAFLLLALHWFNPVLWLSYCLLCRDIEMACDEKVIRNMGVKDRKDYSRALLNCSVPGHILLASPLAFGEVGVKERVKNVLNYKKPALYVMILCLIVSIAVAGCFMTNPKSETPSDTDLMSGENGTVIQTGAAKPTEPAADPLKDWDNTVGPWDYECDDFRLRIPSGWCRLDSDGASGNHHCLEIAPKDMEDCRVRVEAMTSEQYETIFIRKRAEENMTASETTVGYYPGTMYCPAGSDQWKYLVIPADSMHFVIENRFTTEEWETYESSVSELLGFLRIPACDLDHDKAIACAKELFADHDGYNVFASPDYEAGSWTVTFQKSGCPDEVFCLDAAGNCIEHHQEHTYTENHHSDSHHDDHHH